MKESGKQGNREKKKQFDKLLEEIISKGNMRSAYEQVTGNKGAAGVDGVGVSDFNEQLNKEWPLIKTQLEKGEYRPKAVKRVKIPKPNGGVRLLGIPTYMDRLIQQAISQVLVKIYDPEEPNQSLMC